MRNARDASDHGQIGVELIETLKLEPCGRVGRGFDLTRAILETQILLITVKATCTDSTVAGIGMLL